MGFGAMCPQFNLALSLEEAPTFDRDSSLIQPLSGNKFHASSPIHAIPKPSLRRQLSQCLKSQESQLHAFFLTFFLNFNISLIGALSPG